MPPTRVLVVGDLNPDLVLHGDVVPRFGQAEQLLTGATWTLGGSAAITAHGLARLSRPVSLVAAVGADALGTRVRDELAAAGVDVAAIAIRATEPTALTVVLSAATDRAMLTLTGAAATLTVQDAVAALDSNADLAHVHIASPLLVALDGRLLDLVTAARSRGLTVSLDTNDDPAGRWLGIEDLLPHVDVLLPNRDEALALGRDTDLITAARRLAEHGPLVVVKDGSRGATAVAADGDPVHVSAPAVATVVDTTGAGDTFDAAFVDGWLAGLPVRRCLRLAVHAGALAVTAVSGTGAQPGRADLDRIGDAA